MRPYSFDIASHLTAPALLNEEAVTAAVTAVTIPIPQTTGTATVDTANVSTANVSTCTTSTSAETSQTVGSHLTIAGCIAIFTIAATNTTLVQSYGMGGICRW